MPAATTPSHNLPQKMLYDDVLQFWSQTNVAYTPTLLVTLGGLTAETYSYQETEVWKHPLPSRFVPPQVLQARAVRRTLAAEEDCRFDDSANTARLLADLVVIDADLPEDIYNSDRVTRAMLNGRLYEAETLNEIITGQRKTRPFWWQ